MELIIKKELDAQVAELLGKKRREISAVTTAFIQEIRLALLKNKSVLLDRLGTLHIASKRGTFTPKSGTPRTVIKRQIYLKKSKTMLKKLKTMHRPVVRKGVRREKVRSQ